MLTKINLTLLFYNEYLCVFYNNLSIEYGFAEVVFISIKQSLCSMFYSWASYNLAIQDDDQWYYPWSVYALCFMILAYDHDYHDKTCVEDVGRTLFFFAIFPSLRSMTFWSISGMLDTYPLRFRSVYLLVQYSEKCNWPSCRAIFHWKYKQMATDWSKCALCPMLVPSSAYIICSSAGEENDTFHDKHTDLSKGTQFTHRPSIEGLCLRCVVCSEGNFFHQLY